MTLHRRLILTLATALAALAPSCKEEVPPSSGPVSVAIRGGLGTSQTGELAAALAKDGRFTVNTGDGHDEYKDPIGVTDIAILHSWACELPIKCELLILIDPVRFDWSKTPLVYPHAKRIIVIYRSGWVGPRTGIVSGVNPSDVFVFHGDHNSILHGEHISTYIDFIYAFAPIALPPASSSQQARTEAGGGFFGEPVIGRIGV